MSNIDETLDKEEEVVDEVGDTLPTSEELIDETMDEGTPESFENAELEETVS